MIYRIVFTAAAAKEFGALDPTAKARISIALMRLAEAPLSTQNAKALAGGGSRLRVGDYRVLYTTELDTITLLVVQIGHLRKVYRSR